MDSKVKVPILKKDAVITLDLDYQNLGYIAQALMLLAKGFSPEEMEAFKAILANKEPISDLRMAAYINLDMIYRKAIKQAESESKVEYMDVDTMVTQ